MADMRTPLAKVRGLGSAKDGTMHFWHSRVTSVAAIPLTLFFLVLVISLNGATYQEVRATFANPLVSVLTLATLLIIVWHMKLGMQVIIEDYIFAERMKWTLLMLNSFFTGVLALVSIFALLKMAFGA
ncbi:succinate dehydrogenase [Hoeflea sp. BAL378]|uniref:succinate dehydrogenase, hydrophobic membrane anchor protein n=1 Tax=Hoeflea sp. BAL378 TaxID=1547437 RepID=UPI0005145A37|nr:succinate dehydrogenase, hydrophobic membrane anchor protein [Hoeflea sp. BAL378]KGF67544.1 succinate dehydrogenase [Hoeflea sp. BAL378]